MEDFKIKLAPIVIFTYNRPIHTRETIDALLKNQFADESDLIFYSDAPKNEEAKKGVLETRQYIHSITGFKSIRVIERDKNFGLANNIIDGVTSVVNEFGKIIVLEDDLLLSPYFLKFMNEALNKYENDDSVVSVHGFFYPIKENVPENFFLKHTDSLGWGTWKSEWEIFDSDGVNLLNKLKTQNLINDFNFNSSYNFIKMLKKQISGQNNSWAIRWYASAFLAGKLSLFPNKSLVFHNGNDYLGTNCDNSEDWLDVELSDKEIQLIDIPVQENFDVRAVYERFFRTIKGSFWNRLKKKTKSIYGKIKKNH